MAVFPHAILTFAKCVDGSDIIDIRNYTRISGATPGWNMRRGHRNRCLMAVTGTKQRSG